MLLKKILFKYVMFMLVHNALTMLTDANFYKKNVLKITLRLLDSVDVYCSSLVHFK